MAAKRVRTTETKETKYIEFRVQVPGELVPDVVIASSGRGCKPKVAIHLVRFNPTTPYKFWKLWLQFNDYMLYKQGESEPFMDFEAPLAEMEERVFIATTWKPEYARQRQHLAKLRYADDLQRLDKNIIDQEATLVEMRKRREVLAARIEAISEELRANAT